MSELKFKKSYLYILFLAVIFIFSFVLFGAVGLKTFLGFFFILILPIYLIMKFVDIEEDERILFSIFIGLVITSLLIWYVDRIFHNLLLSMIIITILLYASSFIFTIYMKKKLKHE
ncbi:MAG: hypothetical protein KAK00_04915 [Nanoarchaeota archaeon]|nr:hypothetical protein [Nanoarchaeota archaeon]